jgi:hypothetical protein
MRGTNRQRPRARGGITLTEILISILILGVGVVSLATLFPLGLIRLRNAQRMNRGAILADSAAAELGSRNLLYKGSFVGSPGISPWYRTATVRASLSQYFDPWVQDTPFYGGDWFGLPNGTNVDPIPDSLDPTVHHPAGASANTLVQDGSGNYHLRPGVGPGLPVAYDPLWRYVTGIYQNWAGNPLNAVAANPASYTSVAGPAAETRFGSGIGLIRADTLNQAPNPSNGPAILNKTVPSAHGLQRLSNFQATSILNTNANPTTYYDLFAGRSGPSAPYDWQVAQNNLAVLQTFVSPEDPVLQESTGTYIDPNAALPKNTDTPPPVMTGPSTVVPSLTVEGQTSTHHSILRPTTSPVADWRYTWLITGRQSDVTNGTVFDVDIVVCENRPFAMELIVPAGAFPNPPAGAPASGGEHYKAAGERVVEAVYGYSTTPNPLTTHDPLAPGVGLTVPNQPKWGYGSASAARTVLLRWPALLPDPDVRVGSWIADVTYERNEGIVLPNISKPNNPTDASNYFGRFPGPYPAQRCYWYQVAKRTDAGPDVIAPGTLTQPIAGVNPVLGYRSMTVWTTAPLRALTLLNYAAANPQPVHPEAALVMPSVVNVYPRTVYSR